jgi:hypothetical protein
MPRTGQFRTSGRSYRRETTRAAKTQSGRDDGPLFGKDDAIEEEDAGNPSAGVGWLGADSLPVKFKLRSEKEAAETDRAWVERREAV